MPVPVVDNMTPQKDSIAELTKVALWEFLHKMDVTPSKYERDTELELRVKAITRTWTFENQVKRHIVTALVIVETSYTHVSDVDTKVAIVLYTAMLTAVDDPDLFDSAGGQNFWHRICDGSLLQDKSIMGEFARVISGMGRFYSNYSCGAILASSLRFLNGEMIGNPESKAFVEPRSKEFVDFSRDLSGDAEAYGAFIWGKVDFPDEYSYIQTLPDACVYINHTNDILSFYKEEQDGEVTSYIHARAHVTGKSLITTLREVIDEVVAASKRVRGTLGNGKARKAWDSFERGYIGFHIGDPRYRLQDIFGAQSEYMLDVDAI